LVCASVAVTAAVAFGWPAIETLAPAAASTPVVYPAMAGITPEAQIQTLSGTALAGTLSAIAASGAKWLRIDLFWPNVEPSPGTFDWSEPDPVIQGALARGINVLAVPDYTPSWEPTPGSPTAFAAFMTAAARHYAPMGLHAWEIWNEPNLAGSWGSTVNPAAYTATLKAGYRALKGVDPGAEVVAGALSPAVDAADRSEMSPTSFVTQMYAAGAAGYFDALSVHPSSFPDMPTAPDSWNTFYDLPSLHNLMSGHGDGAKKIWLTEYGAPTGVATDAVSPTVQAAMIAQAYAAAAAWPWAGPLFSYWQDAGSNLSYDQDNFGIIAYNGSPKPAYYAFLTAAGRSASSPVRSATTSPSVAGFRIVNRDGMLFAYGGSPRFGSAPSPLARPVVGLSASPDGGGYWMVASDGGVFAFGDARFYGSTGNLRLNQPIVGMAATSTGHGYWLVASDGGVFSFGDARFHGSTGNIRLNQPIVGMAATRSGHGYWMVASDGGVFAFGDAPFYGSAAGLTASPVVALGATSSR
jgi:hypothetical protein